MYLELFVVLSTSVYVVLSTVYNSLIIHEEKTKEIMGVKESVYVKQIHVDLHKL
jgi:hypothetical protein